MSQVRIANTAKRNERLRAAFRKRWTDAPRPRIHSREHIVAQLAEEFFLSPATVEGILYRAGKPPALPAAASRLVHVACIFERLVHQRLVNS